MQIGYARVSTVQQDTALQLAAFERAGVTEIVEEKRSGAAARPKLEALLSRLRPGDELVVYRMDRLARSLVDLLRIVSRIEAAGATFRSLTEALETRTLVGRMLVQLLGVVAEFERGVIRERCAAGRAEALRRGVRFGGPPRIQRADVTLLRDQGLSFPKIAARLDCNLTTVKRCMSSVRRCDGGPGERPRRKR